MDENNNLESSSSSFGSIPNTFEPTPGTDPVPNSFDTMSSSFEPTSSSFEPTTSAFEPTTSAFEPTTSAFEPTTSASDTTTTSSNSAFEPASEQKSSFETYGDAAAPVTDNDSWNSSDSWNPSASTVDTTSTTYTSDFQEPKKESKALEICALVFGILSIVGCCCCGLFGLIGLVLSIICLATGKKSALSITGLICSIVGLIFTIIMSVLASSDKYKDQISDIGSDFGITTEATTDFSLDDFSLDDFTTEDLDTGLTEDTEDTSNTNNQTSKSTSTPTKVDGLSDVYADLDNRSFAINGKVYTVGVTTFQEMIDDGVPFDEDALSQADKDLEANNYSMGYTIELGEYYNAQIEIGNYTDETKKMSECTVTQIYLPVDLERDTGIIQFAFPLTLTEDELTKNSGEPTDQREYVGDGDTEYVSHTLEYKVDSDKYFGSSGYSFEFVNGDLRYVYIDYK